MTTDAHDFDSFGWRDLIRALAFFLENLRRRCLFWTAVIFAVYLYFLVPPFAVGRMVDLFSAGSRNSFPWFMTYAGALALSMGLVSFMRLSAKQVLTGVGIQAGYRARVKGFARMMPLFRADLAENPAAQPFPGDWRALSIRSGAFRYTQSGQEFRVHDLNMEIGRRERIGIAGRSSSGKSTLAKLLLGVYRLESRQILIDRLDLAAVRHGSLTEHISIVLQESELFNMTLRENITLLREIEPGRLERALEIAQLAEVIAKLPDGLETPIGEKGYRLSGGERQRVGIARAVCRDPEILVLDEATSSLDARTELMIHRAVARELKSQTLIIIAHRLSTLQESDRIYVFDDGTVREQGVYQELLANPHSLFHRLHRPNYQAAEGRDEAAAPGRG